MMKDYRLVLAADYAECRVDRAVKNFVALHELLFLRRQNRPSQTLNPILMTLIHDVGLGVE